MYAFLTDSPLVARLGWLLVHSLWQFTAVALFAALLLRLLRHASAEARYWCGLIALGAIVAAPPATWVLLPAQKLAANNGTQAAHDLPATPRMSLSVADEPAPGLAAPGEPALNLRPARPTTASPTASPPSLAAWPSVEQIVSPWLPWIVLIWCGGVLVFSLRPLASCLAIRRLRASSTQAPTAVEAALAKVAKRLRLRRAVAIVQSAMVRAPVVVGWLRPLILLPVGIVCELPAAQLDAILAHELAHIRRHDFLINMLQTLVETLCFYHPAVWFLSQRIRLERENCCDDLAVAAMGNRGEYGRALLAVEELRGGQPTLVLSAGGGSLLARVRRIVAAEPAEPSYLGSGLAAIGLVVALAAGLWAMAYAADSTAPDIAPPPATAWPQWGGSALRNNVSLATNLPTAWDVARKQNIRWTAPLGTFSFNSPVVSQGSVLIGTNNGAERNPKFPAKVDMTCLQCFNEQTGEFLWQYASPKLPTGRVHDWPEVGLCATPAVQGDRVWVVTNRAEVLCLDLLGFRDGQNDGPVSDEAETDPKAADVIWRLDMMRQLGVSQTYQSCSSVTLIGDLVLLNTGNGVDESHQNIPAPGAPSFLAVNRHTGHVVWSDASPDKNILGGECPSTSPAVGVLGGVLQAIFAGADGWLYAFDVRAMEQGRTVVLWKFDCNPKTSRRELGHRGTRNSIIAAPVIHEGRVHLPVGQNPEHGEGPGHLWCIDPTKRGDISPELVFNKANPDQPIPPKRLQACEEDKGDFTRPNLNSGVIWHYDAFDQNGDGKIAFDEALHRCCGSAVIADGLVVVADFSGLLHCLDAQTGKPLWKHDLLAAVWSTPLIADGKIYVGDEDGDVAIFCLARTKTLLAEPNVNGPIYGTPAAVNGGMFLSTKTQLLAIQAPPPPGAAQPVAVDPKQPWTVRGRVVDDQGAPVAGAEIIAHCGAGTLQPTGSATTGEDGNYEFKFGPGIMFSGEDHAQTQFASISVRKQGLVEKNLHRQGCCVASLKPPSAEALKSFGVTKEHVFLPGQPLTIDFALLPAARVRGTLVDEQDRPLAEYSVALTGKELPPSSSVLRSTKTDERGRFELSEIPTSFAFQFDIREPNPKPPWDDSWASPPLFFERSEGMGFAVHNSQEQIAVEQFRLKIVGTGVHGKAAVAGAEKQPLVWQGKSQLEQSPGTLAKRAAQELTLVLQNAQPAAENPPDGGPKDAPPGLGGM